MVKRPFFAALPCFDDVSFDCWSLVDIALFVESTAVVVIFVVVSDVLLLLKIAFTVFVVVTHFVQGISADLCLCLCILMGMCVCVCSSLCPRLYLLFAQFKLFVHCLFIADIHSVFFFPCACLPVRFKQHTHTAKNAPSNFAWILFLCNLWATKILSNISFYSILIAGGRCLFLLFSFM